MSEFCQDACVFFLHESQSDSNHDAIKSCADGANHDSSAVKTSMNWLTRVSRHDLHGVHGMNRCAIHENYPRVSSGVSSSYVILSHYQLIFDDDGFCFGKVAVSILCLYDQSARVIEAKLKHGDRQGTVLGITIQIGLFILII